MTKEKLIELAWAAAYIALENNKYPKTKERKEKALNDLDYMWTHLDSVDEIWNKMETYEPRIKTDTSFCANLMRRLNNA